MDNLDKSKLEAELLLAQKEKVQAEIAVLKRTTPVTESIKIIGSLVIGIGGAIAAIFGFQFAEIKSEKFKLEAEKAIQMRDSVNKQAAQVKQISDSLQNNNDSLQLKIAQSISTLEQLSDKISSAQSESKSKEVLGTLQQDANAAAINLRASISSSQIASSPAKSLNTSIQELFDPKASVRGAAYNQIMTYHADKPELVPSLIEYANKHLDNENGIYNTLVVLGNIDYNKVPRDVLPAIRSFAEKTRNNGPKTSEKTDKVLQRLPK